MLLMPYKVPDEDAVISAIEIVLNKTPHIDTQKEFSDRVRKELLKKDKEYRISGERVRRIGLDRGVVKVTIEYRESDLKSLPHICPVCKNAMSPVMNRSLDGDIVEVKRKCTVCPYAVGQNVLVPGRYIFSRAPKKDISPQDEIIRALNKAGAKIKESINLINNALNGTDLEERSSALTSDLHEMIGSDELSYSIKNITADVKDMDDPPVWMTPVRSIKNVDRKDI